MRRPNIHRTLRVPISYYKFINFWFLLFFIVVSDLWAVELGAGKLDIGMTLTGAWDDNVNYADTSTEEATEVQFMPGVNYTLPFQHHQFSVGYLGTYVTSNHQNARSIRHSPTAGLLLDFPGDLQIEISDIFSRVQDYRKEETEELVGPDYALNQAGVTIGFNRPGLVNYSANYQNIIYRFEPSSSDRNSDNNEVGTGMMIPFSQTVAGLVNGRWVEERVFEHTERSYKNFEIGTGVHYSGPSHVDFELTLGYQSFVYMDDPNNNIEESLLGKAEINAAMSSSLSANFEIHSDIRANSAFSGSLDLTPRTNTTVHIGFSREISRTFYQDSKYYIDNIVSMMVRQRLFERFSVFGEGQYAFAKFEKSETIVDVPNREDTRRKWRAGIQYAVGNWIELGIQGEHQKRESNVSIAYAEFSRTVIGISATFKTP